VKALNDFFQAKSNLAYTSVKFKSTLMIQMMPKTGMKHKHFIMLI